jgi:SDR family mycofactocin-dependent oxidoreductase
MPGRLGGKVALITGGARGQGRSHAVRFAEEGADIVVLDLCAQIATNPYPLATPEDLEQTVKEVESLGRRIVARKADVRERSQVLEVVEAGIEAFGHLDIVVANAGILPMGTDDPKAFTDALDVDLIGVMNTVAVTLDKISDGGSIVVTGSTAGLMNNTTSTPAMGPGGAGYGYAKKVISTYIEQLALFAAPRMIRVNAVHPTNTNTHLLHHDGIYRVFRPDLEAPTREDAEMAFNYFQALPIPYIEPSDVSNLMLYLASDESRYVTGMNIRIDAGSLVKFPNGPA